MKSAHLPDSMVPARSVPGIRPRSVPAYARETGRGCRTGDARHGALRGRCSATGSAPARQCAFPPRRITSTGLRPLTPEYAAPEQVHGEVVSTAADVYALGVLLCELLRGERPNRFEHRSLEAIARVVRDEPPRLPSVAVAEPHSCDRASIAAQRAPRRRRCGDGCAATSRSRGSNLRCTRCTAGRSGRHRVAGV